MFPAAIAKYLDRATEFEVQRLTDPSCTSRLPAYYSRCVSDKKNFLLYWSDRTGSPQALRLDLKSGQSELVTHAVDLDGTSLWLLPGDQEFCFWDGNTMMRTSLSTGRERELYKIEDGYRRAQGYSISSDARFASFVEKKENSSGFRLQLFDMRLAQVSTLFETTEPIADPILRPGARTVFYRLGKTLGVIDPLDRRPRTLPEADGEVGPANWSPDGKTILYLNDRQTLKERNTIRLINPEDNSDKLVAPTSQYAHFGQNGDASVFVGASLSKAGPYIILLLRLTRRELTLCEHKSSDPSQVAPIFSSDSQTIFFQSDRHGKMAIYRISVDKLVERTES